MAQRQHGGAGLTNIPLTLPSFKGLNKEQETGILGPEWATVLRNAVFDSNNRIAVRQGWTKITSTPAAAVDFVKLHELVKRDGTVQLFATSATAIYRSTDSGSTWTAVTGTASFTDGNWQFVNFNDKVIGVQSGKTPIVYTTAAGSFAPIVAASGTAPTGSSVVAHSGRLWITDSTGAAVSYCGLLDETDWGSADAGSFDFTSVWKDNDRVVAQAWHNGAWIIFGTRNILFYTDGAGSKRGLDPTNAYVADTLGGVGCVTPETVVNVKGDLWFLSNEGLQSIGRLINERSNPINNLTKNVLSKLQAEIAAMVDVNAIRAGFDYLNHRFVLSFPTGETTTAGDAGTCYILDTRQPMEDGTYRIADWTQFVPSCMVVLDGGQVLYGRAFNQGEVGDLDARLDDAEPIPFDYESAWMDLQSATMIKIPKKLQGTFYASGDSTVVFKWAFDFETDFYTHAVSMSVPSVQAEFNIAEFNIAEFSSAGAVALRRRNAQGRGTGQFIKIGLETTANDTTLAVQQLDIYAKIGRMA